MRASIAAIEDGLPPPCPVVAEPTDSLRKPAPEIFAGPWADSRSICQDPWRSGDHGRVAPRTRSGRGVHRREERCRRADRRPANRRSGLGPISIGSVGCRYFWRSLSVFISIAARVATLYQSNLVQRRKALLQGILIPVGRWRPEADLAANGDLVLLSGDRIAALTAFRRACPILRQLVLGRGLDDREDCDGDGKT